MKDFFRHNGVWLLVIALLLSILIGLTSAFMGGNADPLSNLVNTVTAPVRSGIAAAADWAEGVYSYVFHYGEIPQQMEELLTDLAILVCRGLRLVGVPYEVLQHILVVPQEVIPGGS